MIKKVSKIVLVAGALFALPGIAQAGTATATGTATLTVINQCTVTGANVDLGTYMSGSTWSIVGTALGSYDGTTFTASAQGAEYLDFGSVTCDAGAPYTLSIKGTATDTPGAIKLTQGGKVATFLPGIKSIGGVRVADASGTLVGTGAQVWANPVSGTGTGSPQSLRGNVTLSFVATGTTALPTDTLGAAGTVSDTLTYTLNF